MFGTRPEDITYLRDLKNEPVEVLPVDSLLGDPIEGKDGYFHTIEGDKTKAGYIDVFNNGALAYRYWHTRHAPTGSAYYYHKCVIHYRGQDIEAWEIEIPKEEEGG